VWNPNKSEFLVLGSAGRRILNSTFLLVIATFFVGYVSLFFGLQNLASQTDLATLELPPWMVQFTPTVPNYLTSHKKPEILLMGSSLVLSPAALIQRSRNCTGYDCTYFEDALQQRTGKRISVDNIGVISGMACDQYAILKEAIEAGRKPSFIIYGMAPRDLADNLTSVENSPTQQVLASCRSATRFFPESLKPEDLELCLNNHKLSANRWLKALRREATRASCAVSKHPASLQDTVPAKPKQLTHAHTQQLVVLKDLEIYRQRYNPPNFERLKGQSAYLDSFLGLCAQNHIPILLVNMPLPDVNRNVIPPELMTAYKDAAKKIAEKYSNEIYDLDGNIAFADNLNNFNDCVHLNANGGKKFFTMLADILVADKPFIATYDIKNPTVAHTNKTKTF
jgi:hypothetical protein